ncbi:hypothetical protein EUTSA_v10002804mg [Eutrema salsugineum]|uniref:UDP-glycosyltransferases domain-containing protein n=1 Tax=Eutrema salsugineum TaxID=72664 RepID=V4KHJ5_EUTSA|nr:hypothetical protein EUTSA_v10002804mg [Eutrema salsugineum]
MEKREAKRRIVLVSAPAQGHVTPMMQLGKALNLKGFLITVVQGEINQVSSSAQQSSGFQYITIPESVPESEVMRLGLVKFLMKLNNAREASFKDCIGRLLLQQGNDIACIIYDEITYFCAAAAKDFNLPSIIFSTTTATHRVCCTVLSKLNAKKFLMDMQGT